MLYVVSGGPLNRFVGAYSADSLAFDAVRKLYGQALHRISFHHNENGDRSIEVQKKVSDDVFQLVERDGDQLFVRHRYSVLAIEINETYN